MGQIRWSHEAFDWLKNVHDYIAQDKPGVAEKIVKGILQKINLLREFPEMGYQLTLSSQKHVRVILYGHYRIVYQIGKEQNINIVGIFHGALDLKRYLKAN